MSDADPLRFLDRPTADSSAPSEWALDRYAAGELAGADKARVETWLAAHPEARTALEARKRFPAGVDGDALFARIQHGLPRAAAPGATVPTDAKPWWRRLFSLGPGMLALVAAAAAIALFIVRPWAGPAGIVGLYPDRDLLRAKGGFDFMVHRQTADGSEVLVSGSRAREGDRLRFEIALSDPRYVMVVDQDPRGALATAWPLDGSDAARLMQPEARALDGAVALDDALGDEWLIAIACERPLRLADVAATAPGALKLPEACKALPLRIEKVAP